MVKSFITLGPSYNMNWIQHVHVVAPKFFAMKFYKGIIGK